MKKNKSNSVKIAIGDKNLSSWSMRPWLALKHSGIEFEEVMILLDRPETRKQIQKYSPSGRVPVLIHDDLTIWDSLAICEYLAELAPHLWPKDSKQKAIARSYVAEMHSGFTSLRSQLSMDIQLQTKIKHLLPSTISDIERVLELWQSALKKYKGPYLFGDFSIADAFYAPVVMRFKSYGINIRNKACLQYMNQILNYSYVKEWVDQAKKEIPHYLSFGSI